MEHKFIEYMAGDLKCRGYFIKSGDKEKRPCVIVIHAFMGQDDFARKKAESFHKLGYNAFACDLYGDGISVKSRDEAAQLMKPLFIDRKLLRERILAAFETVKLEPSVDNDKIGAIGFCFGGLAALELLKSGVNVRGVTSFHGTLTNSLRDMRAETAPIAKNITGSILMLHGYEDPLMTDEDIQTVQKELNDAGIDWQMHIYGHTKHAFTNPNVNEPSIGLVYDAKANNRSLQSMENFFKEVFGK